MWTIAFGTDQAYLSLHAHLQLGEGTRFLFFRIPPLKVLGAVSVSASLHSYLWSGQTQEGKHLCECEAETLKVPDNQPFIFRLLKEA